jgi:hypothetical protein
MANKYATGIHKLPKIEDTKRMFPFVFSKCGSDAFVMATGDIKLTSQVFWNPSKFTLEMGPLLPG